MCAEEFATFLDNTRKAPLEEKLSAFGDIIEKIMSIVLRIPDLVDQSLGLVTEKVSNLQNQLNSLNSQITSLQSGSGGTPAAAPAPTAPAAARAPGGPPPPPPPGGPPGGPRGPGPAPGPSRPASPVSLRGAIMGELKSLFAKRKNQSG
ncbi:MAG: hypothetical protein CEE43_06120 [Promethearchaeota archaeon Loki_b32]|nr:MAG: hypothetical protein CEE43_06120 [Candidatus Lokiarchaeota archaeon Loki_b32]